MAGLRMTCWVLAEQHKIYFPALSFGSERSYRFQSEQGSRDLQGGDPGSATGPGAAPASGAEAGRPRRGGDASRLSLCSSGTRWQCGTSAAVGRQPWRSPGEVGTPGHPWASLRIPARPSASLPVTPIRRHAVSLDKMWKGMLLGGCHCSVPPTIASLPKLDFMRLWK